MKREEILALAARFGIENIRIFGSVARHEARDGSDIDFLVEFPSGVSLLTHQRSSGNFPHYREKSFAGFSPAIPQRQDDRSGDRREPERDPGGAGCPGFGAEFRETNHGPAG